MTRLWIPGAAISAVVNAADEPTAFHWRSRDHAVDTILTHWRVDLRWWARRIWRDYFELTTMTGLLVVIYHDRVENAWYLQRLYD